MGGTRAIPSTKETVEDDSVESIPEHARREGEEAEYIIEESSERGDRGL